MLRRLPHGKLPRSPALAFVLVASALLAPSCSGQIRHAERIQSDPYIKYTDDQLNRRRSERVLELLPPDSPANLNDLGVAHTRRLELDLAEERLTAAIKARPALTLPYLNLARLYTICEEPARASRVHLHMAANRLLSGDRLYRLARGLFDQGRRAEALSLMEALVRHERSGTAPADWLGFYYLDLGQLARAATFFERSLEIQPTGGPGLYGQGVTYFRAGDFRRATVFLEAARQRGEKRPDLTLELATALVESGEFDKARELIEAAADRSQPALVRLHGRILLRENYRRNLRSLPAPQDRGRLLREWYGTEQPEELTPLYDEFDLLY